MVWLGNQVPGNITAKKIYQNINQSYLFQEAYSG